MPPTIIILSLDIILIFFLMDDGTEKKKNESEYGIWLVLLRTGGPRDSSSFLRPVTATPFSTPDRTGADRGKAPAQTRNRVLPWYRGFPLQLYVCGTAKKNESSSSFLAVLDRRDRGREPAQTRNRVLSWYSGFPFQLYVCGTRMNLCHRSGERCACAGLRRRMNLCDHSRNAPTASPLTVLVTALDPGRGAPACGTVAGGAESPQMTSITIVPNRRRVPIGRDP